MRFKFWLELETEMQLFAFHFTLKASPISLFPEWLQYTSRFLQFLRLVLAIPRRSIHIMPPLLSSPSPGRWRLTGVAVKWPPQLWFSRQYRELRPPTPRRWSGSLLRNRCFSLLSLTILQSYFFSN